MWMLLLSLALAGKWDGKNADVVAERVIAAPATALYDYLMDLDRYRVLYSQDCIGTWEKGTQSAGFGATATARYDMGAMHRKLPIVLQKGSPGVYVDYHHPGNKGFTTRWAFTEVEGGTRVVVNTAMNAPPWPLTGYYFQGVQPEWVACQSEALDALAQKVKG